MMKTLNFAEKYTYLMQKEKQYLFYKITTHLFLKKKNPLGFLASNTNIVPLDVQSRIKETCYVRYSIETLPGTPWPLSSL